MNSWLRALNKVIKGYDSCLYAQETKLGRYDVYRKSALDCNPPHFLFALTDTWAPQGKPIQYGIEVVMNRIKAHDLWRDDRFMDNFIKNHEAVEESKERSFRNSIESFLYDFRKDFANATKDINTANLNKVHRKEPSYGYR